MMFQSHSLSRPKSRLRRNSTRLCLAAAVAAIASLAAQDLNARPSGGGFRGGGGFSRPSGGGFSTLPASCYPYAYGSYRYYSCSGTWYQQTYKSGSTVYVVVSDPTKK